MTPQRSFEDTAPGRGFSRLQIVVRACALAAFIALVLLRLPVVVAQGRFWAEEGALYFHNAQTLPWWRAALRPEHGYLSLFANLAGLFADYCVPLAQAPRATAGLALLAQCLPALILVTARDTWLRPVPAIVASVLLIAMPPLCDEVWLNTANSQFHLALAAALCVALDVPAGQGNRRWRSAFLVLAPLCSPIAIALTPVPVLRAILARSRLQARARATQAACLLAGAVPQLFFIIQAPLRDRGAFIGPVTMSYIFAARHLAAPFLGENAANRIALGWLDAVRAGHLPVLPVCAVVAVTVVLVAAVALSRRAVCPYLPLCGLVFAVLSYNGAVAGGINLIGVSGSQRYAFAPSMLFALTVVSLCSVERTSIAHPAKLIAVWLLGVSVWQTIRPQDPVYTSGPAWQAELSRWHADPTYAVKIWPAGWKMHLLSGTFRTNNEIFLPRVPPG